MARAVLGSGRCHFRVPRSVAVQSRLCGAVVVSPAAARGAPPTRPVPRRARREGRVRRTPRPSRPRALPVTRTIEWGSGKEHGKFEQCLLERTLSGRTPSAAGAGVGRAKIRRCSPIRRSFSVGSRGQAAARRTIASRSRLREMRAARHSSTRSRPARPAATAWPRSLAGRRLAPARARRTPALISAEIMFWVEAAGVARPAGVRRRSTARGGRQLRGMAKGRRG